MSCCRSERGRVSTLRLRNLAPFLASGRRDSLDEPAPLRHGVWYSTSPEGPHRQNTITQIPVVFHSLVGYVARSLRTSGPMQSSKAVVDVVVVLSRKQFDIQRGRASTVWVCFPDVPFPMVRTFKAVLTRLMNPSKHIGCFAEVSSQPVVPAFPAGNIAAGPRLLRFRASIHNQTQSCDPISCYKTLTGIFHVPLG